MTAKLTASLRQAPATVPAAVALALFVVWATDQGGYPVTHWAPGAVLVLALFGLTAAIVGRPLAEMPVGVKIALGCLTAYTALSFLSILWASVGADAWEGANRTLLYLAVFALFCSWPQRGATAAMLLVGWVLAMIVLAAYAALHIDAAAQASLPSLLPSGRLTYPTGYPNANAAQWLMAFWPALLLARSERLPWALRGLLAGGATLLADVALLSQSRGSLFATPVMLVLVFALLPRRVRTFAVLVPVAGAIAASAPAVLRVGDHLSAGSATTAHVHSAIVASFAGALVAGAIVALGAAVEARAPVSGQTRARVRQLIAALAIALLVGGLVAGLAVAGDPVARARSAWHSFKGGYGNASGGSRLVSGLGSNRYDFYRVALNEFLAHPALGIGVDNFQQQYMRHGRSSETPRYPHSVELRALTQTGVIGSLLAVAGLAAALVAAGGALRQRDPLAAAVAAAALGAFAYWAVHGSVDWFWEFAGLGAPAFAMLGLACSLAPPRVSLRPARPTGRLRAATLVAGVLVGLLLAASLIAPWLSRLEIEEASRVWTRSATTAYARLRDAASLNSLSDEADALAGSIALRYGDLARADHEFALALRRNANDSYALLERGAIASARGQRARALALLERAHELDPREPLIEQALALVRSGGRISIEELNRAILLKGEQLG
jgi:O-antigen ligase